MTTDTGEQILVVEDDEFIALRLQNILTGFGYVVPATVASGEEAVQQAAETQPDLILMDIQLAGEMDGIEAARQIHARFDIPLVYLTAYANNETLQQAKFTEPFGYLLKPFKERELRSTIEMALYKHKMEQKLREQAHALGERVKELNCLYGIADLVETPGISLEDILQGTVELIPPAWQYPEITCARISLKDQEVRTANFRETAWQQTANIIVRGERTGSVAVCYLEQTPVSHERPFLKDERKLLNAIAGRLGRIIERVQAEVALRESEAKWRSLVETAPVTIATLDREGTILFINRPLRTGLTPRQVIGTSIHRYLPPHEQAKTRKILASVFESGGSVRYETTIINNDGNALFYENRVAPIKIDDQVVAVTYMVLNITEHKQVEETLQDSIEKLKIAYQQATIYAQELTAEISERKRVEEELKRLQE